MAKPLFPDSRICRTTQTGPSTSSLAPKAPAGKASNWVPTYPTKNSKCFSASSTARRAPRRQNVAPAGHRENELLLPSDGGWSGENKLQISPCIRFRGRHRLIALTSCKSAETHASTAYAPAKPTPGPGPLKLERPAIAFLWTAESFIRAETDRTFEGIGAKMGGSVGRLRIAADPAAALDNQVVERANRDTLYSHCGLRPRRGAGNYNATRRGGALMTMRW